VRTPHLSRLHAFRSFSVGAVAAPRPRALKRPLPFPALATRLPARPTYGLLDLAEEAGRASAQPAGPARTRPSITAITDLAGTDAEIVFVTCHEMTIGSRNTSRKSRNATIAEERRNTYASVSASASRISHIASDVAETAGNKEESIGSAPASPHWLKLGRVKAMCRQKLMNEVPAARQLALSCLPNRVGKVNSFLRFFAISLNKQRCLSRCFDCEQRSPSAISTIATCILQVGSMCQSARNILHAE
jgi:hypothetical protein